MNGGRSVIEHKFTGDRRIRIETSGGQIPAGAEFTILENASNHSRDL
jgi:hypothetical protein